MELTQKDLKVMRYLSNGAAPLRPLFQTMGKSAVYRADRKLRNAGLVHQSGRNRGLTPKGRAALAQAERGSVEEIDLAKHVPHIALAPTVLQRAFLTLIAAAIPLRLYRVVPSHHASFIAVGPKLTWKSWLAKLACLMVGIDPREFVLNLGAETSGSLLPRRGARGQVVSERLAIGQPVIGLDELGRAGRDTKRALQVLTFGDIEIPFENETFEVRAVPIVTLNPKSKKAGADLADILGLDEGTIRRAVIVDLSKLEIPEEMIGEGDTLLDRARALGPADFPEPQHPDRIPTDEVKEILVRLLDSPKRLGEIDVTMVALLCMGLTAWLSPADALRVGMRSYLEVVSTLGWLKPDWRDKLAAVIGAEASDTGAADAARDEPANPLDYTTKVDEMLESCRKLDIAPEKGADLMAVVEGLGVDQTMGVAELGGTLKSAGISVGDCAKAVGAAKELADALGIQGSRAARLIPGVIRTILHSLPSDAGPGELRKSVAAAAVKGAEVGEIRHRVVEARRELADLQDRCERDRETAREAREERDRLEDERLSLSEQVQKLRRRLTGLMREYRRRQRDIRLGEDVLQLLACEIPLDGPFAYELQHYLALRARGEWLQPAAQISGASAVEIFDRFIHVFDSSIVPEWRLSQVRSDAFREGVQAAQAEIRERLEEAHASGNADAAAIRALEELGAGLRLLSIRGPVARSGV